MVITPGSGPVPAPVPAVMASAEWPLWAMPVNSRCAPPAGCQPARLLSKPALAARLDVGDAPLPLEGRAARVVPLAGAGGGACVAGPATELGTNGAATLDAVRLLSATTSRPMATMTTTMTTGSSKSRLLRRRVCGGRGARCRGGGRGAKRLGGRGAERPSGGGAVRMIVTVAPSPNGAVTTLRPRESAPPARG